MKSLFCIAIAVLSLFLSCSPAPRGRMAATLDEVAGYVCERPDSALTVLQAIDSTVLKTRALRAKYSLLHVMALDKSYKDISAPGLLDPAVDYYSEHGSPDEKLKVLYYQGRVLQHEADLKGAAIAYSQAERYVDNATDTHAVALLYDAFACVYNLVYNTEKQREYIEKALAVLKESGDPMYGSVLGELAMVYHTKKEWAKADSLYQVAIVHAEPYPDALAGYLSNYARMKMLQPEKDPSGAIELLDRKRLLSGGVLTPKEAGAYAFALALTGEKAASESLRARLDALTGQARYDALPWLVRMAFGDGDTFAAYRYLSEAHAGEEALIAETLTDSVTQALQDHSERVAQLEREKKLKQGFSAIIVIALLAIIALLLVIRQKQILAERDHLVSLLKSLESDLRDSEARMTVLSTNFSSSLDQLRRQLLEERLERAREMSVYGDWFWKANNQQISKGELFRLLKDDLWEVFKPEKDIRILEQRLDSELDGLVSRFKKDMHLANESRDLRLFCYLLAGLKPDVIADLLQVRIDNVYVRKNRLLGRIRKHNKPEYEDLLK